MPASRHVLRDFAKIEDVSVKKIILSLMLVAGCSKKDQAPPPQAAPAAAPAPVAAAAKACSADTDCGDKQLCLHNQCMDITAGMAECGAVRVHFDLNQSELHPTDRANLDHTARCLRADQALHVTIEGNADERGSEEFNLALGERRAVAVDKYLLTMGVSDTQLKTISYGKEHPLCREHDEKCWEENRRAAVKPKEDKKKK